jgi:predicted MFS family arabinose efflux permease
MTPAARRLTLSFLTIIYAFGFIDRIVIALVAQGMKADLRISDLEIGLLGGTAFAVVNVFAALPLARLSERVRRTRVVAVSLAAGSAFAMLSGFAGSYWQLLLLRMGMAAGSAGTEAPAHSAISDMYDPSRRASALAVFTLGVPVASILGSYFGGAVDQAYGWRATFLAFGGVGLLVAGAGLALPKEPPRAAADPALAGASVLSIAARLGKQAFFRQLMLATCIGALASFGVNTFLPAFLTRNYGLGARDAGLMFGLISGAASAIGALVGGFGAERLARRNPGWLLGAPAIGLVIGAPLLILGVNTPDLKVAAPVIFAASCFFYTWLGPAIAVTHGLLDSRSRATGSALFLLTMHLVGQGLGPPVIGWASDSIAAWRFGAADFSSVCVGAAAMVPHSRCATASAEGIRYAIALFALIFLWAAVHLAIGARQRAKAVSR